jgi:hypothetical protein
MNREKKIVRLYTSMDEVFEINDHVKAILDMGEHYDVMGQDGSTLIAISKEDIEGVERGDEYVI